MTDTEKPYPWQPEVPDPEPLADTDYTRSTGEAAGAIPTVPDDAQETAGALLEWIGDDPERAEAAQAVNDERSSPWKTVSEKIDSILG